jgi:hypothetical protein
MTTLYEIVKTLHDVSGNNDKLAILQQHKDNELLKQYMKAVMDPAINYWQTKLPKYDNKTAAASNIDFGLETLADLHDLAERKVTGKGATKQLASTLSAHTDEGVKLIEYIIKRKLGTSKVGDTMVLKTWPGLFFIPPYMRCAGMDAKVLAHYKELPHFYVQPKRDGSFAYLCAGWDFGGKVALITRTGNYYPQWLAEKILEGGIGYLGGGYEVFAGELEVYARGPNLLGTPVLLDRKTGNGILNSAQSSESAAEFSEYIFKFVAWDLLASQEWESGASERDYAERLDDLAETLKMVGFPNIEMIETHEVSSTEEAFEINTKLTTEGKEGTVWKKMSGKWKDTSSGTKDMVKLKVKFQVECKVTGFYEGEGKAAGMLGGIEIATEDDLLQCNCGSGFSDDARKEFWRMFNEHGTDDLIATIEANDVITNKNRPDIMALSLPIFIELRSDRKQADTLARVIEQRDSARMGK